jgi:hypothetical protein
MVNRFLLLSVTAAVLSFCLSASAAAENLALHKSYTMKPMPNYTLCTDDGDAVQLTDGKAPGCNWGYKSTVGWQLMEKPVDITIDLGKTGVIQEIRIYTIGGGFAGVEFPIHVVGFVSPDGKNFEFAGAVDANQTAGLRKDTPQRIPITLVIKNINKTGRFVKILLEPKGTFLFLDEIEVIGNFVTANSIPAEVKNNRSEPINPWDIFVSIEKKEQLKRNLTAIIETMHRKDTGFSQDFTSSVLNELASIGADISKCDMKSASLDALRNKLNLIRAKIYGAFYKKDYVCLITDPMETREEKTMLLIPPEASNEISLDIWRGEYEPAAVNIINCSGKKLQLAVSLSPLSGPNSVVIDSKSTIAVRRAIYVSAKEKGEIADALVLQEERPFEIQPGEISQIWLSVRNPALKAGTYKGSIGFMANIPEANQYPIKTIALNIKVEPFELTVDTKLGTCVWAYPEYISAAKNHIKECAKDMREHYTNVFVVHPSNVPYLHNKKQIQARQEDEFRQFGQMIDEYSYARTFLLFLAFTPDKKDYGRFGLWGSTAWQKEFAVWLKDITNILKGHGIGYDRFALYPFDELLGKEFYEIAKQIKTIDPKIRIYANSFGEGPADFNRLQSLIDIWCLSRSECEKHPGWLENIKGFGKEVWTYQARPPGKANEPYSYYRLLPWWAFQNGLTGFGFWVYADPYSDDSWDDYYAPAGHYGVVYGAAGSPVVTGGENIIPSRRWEAWREGIEDYMYLEELQKAADKIKITNPAKATQIQQFIKNQVDAVVKSPNDYSKINEARNQINNFLAQLAKEDSKRF